MGSRAGRSPRGTRCLSCRRYPTVPPRGSRSRAALSRLRAAFRPRWASCSGRCSGSSNCPRVRGRSARGSSGPKRRPSRCPSSSRPDTPHRPARTGRAVCLPPTAPSEQPRSGRRLRRRSSPSRLSSCPPDRPRYPGDSSCEWRSSSRTGRPAPGPPGRRCRRVRTRRWHSVTSGRHRGVRRPAHHRLPDRAPSTGLSPVRCRGRECR